MTETELKPTSETPSLAARSYSLVPCPFCGSKALQVKVVSGSFCYIKCRSCGTTGPEELSITSPRWNTRADQPRPAVPDDAEVSELISQRDYWEARATELAQRVGEHFGFDVGEHSNLNCPVLNALESKWERPAGPDYAYATVAEYESIVGFSVNESFRIGWDMARTTNIMLSAQQPEGGDDEVV